MPAEDTETKSGSPTGAPEPPQLPETAASTNGATAMRRFVARTVLTKDMHDRLTLFVVRALFFFIAAGLGVAGARVLGEVTNRHDLEPTSGILIACATALGLIALEMLFSKSPIRTLSAITFGLLIGLALSLVFQFVIEFIVTALTTAEFRGSYGPQLLAFLQVLTAIIFSYFGVTTLLRTKDDFKFIIPYVEFRKELRGHAPLVLDTSCFVDGRIQPILATGVLDERLIVPKFVLAELQTVADSQDRSLRERGRRGMDILHEIERAHHIEIADRPARPGEPVDSALIAFALEVSGKVVTTDFNLQKNARLQGIQVININDLATALKPAFVPGESMTVRLLREGEDKGQAVGFLRDGTMVVVENARARIGHEVAVEVTSSLQTNAGKMVFGRLRRRESGEA
jgi:uncharacterized protein YacL